LVDMCLLYYESLVIARKKERHGLTKEEPILPRRSNLEPVLT